MKTAQFNLAVEAQIERCTNVLIKKAKEYATEDRLHNFKVAAALQGGTPEQALAGMWAKHIVSVFDMCNSGKEYSEEMWNEKITDSINYLLLLRAMVEKEDVEFDGDDIIVESEQDAKKVLEAAAKMIADYGQCSVADLYDLLGVKSVFADTKYGWKEVKEFAIETAYDVGGFRLVFPTPVTLD